MTETDVSHRAPLARNWLQRLTSRWTGARAPAADTEAAQVAAAQAAGDKAEAAQVAAAQAAGDKAEAAQAVIVQVEGGESAAAPLDVAGLEKQVAKLGREQFKFNTLLEKQQAQVQAALDQLRAQDARREQERAELAAQRPAELAEARLQVVQRLLPVLDGLDEALAAGKRLLERAPSPLQLQAISPRPSKRASWWSLLLAALALWLRPARPLQSSERERQQRALAALSADLDAWQAAYLAWLRGLELVRERLLETFAMEGVGPLETVGQPFDPHRHVAIDTAPARDDAPPGTVVSELRRGYAVDDRVLRYAEVVVARTTHADLRGLGRTAGSPNLESLSKETG